MAQYYISLPWVSQDHSVSLGLKYLIVSLWRKISMKQDINMESLCVCARAYVHILCLHKNIISQICTKLLDSLVLIDMNLILYNLSVYI